MFSRPLIRVVEAMHGRYDTAILVTPIVPNGSIGLTQDAVRALTSHCASEVIHCHISFCQCVAIKDQLDHWRTNTSSGELSMAMLLGFGGRKTAQQIHVVFDQIMQRFKSWCVSKGASSEQLEWIQIMSGRLRMLSRHDFDMLSE